MGTSRYGHLAVRAAAARCLDYAQADYTDPQWILREALILDELERQSWRKIGEAAHEQILALMSMQVRDSGGFDSLQSILQDQLNQIGYQYAPWADWAITDEAKQRLREKDFEQQKTDYENAFDKIGSIKIQEAEKKGRFYLLAVRFRRRVHEESREFTLKQRQWLDNADKAQLGDALAWRRISHMDNSEIVQLFSDTFDRRDVLEDVRKELELDVA